MCLYIYILVNENRVKVSAAVAVAEGKRCPYYARGHAIRSGEKGDAGVQRRSGPGGTRRRTR